MAEQVIQAMPDDEVTAYTASLWQYQPTPPAEQEPEPAPEYLNSLLECDGGRVIAARVRGKKHKHDGTNCDDWYEAAAMQDILCLAAADGAGSRRFSRVGARLSCQAAVAFLQEKLAALLASQPELRQSLQQELASPQCVQACGQLAELVQQAVAAAAAALDKALEERAADPAYSDLLGRQLCLQDFAATLLLALAVPLADKQQLIVACQVGDGMLAALDSTADFPAALKLLGEADWGEFSGETDFLTEPKMREAANLKSRTKIYRGRADWLLLLTDGVADDYFPQQPELLRLYFDLLVNGIIDLPADWPAPGEGEMQLPPPQVYPWVNDHNVQVAVQYTRRIAEVAGLTLADFWQQQAGRSLLAQARQAMAQCPAGPLAAAADPSQRLQFWLDNYVERGSFDDRTLLLAQLY